MIMKDVLLLLSAFLITFFLGFFVCLGAFPYIISYVAHKVITTYEEATDKEVFRWSVAFIVAFGSAILLRECN